MNQETLQKLRKSPDWQELEAHILQHIRSLDRLTDIELTDDRQMAVEMLARKRAAEKLALILKPFLDLSEAPETAQESEGDLYHEHLITK